MNTMKAKDLNITKQTKLYHNQQKIYMLMIELK
jgi:hypothetical protein